MNRSRRGASRSARRVRAPWALLALVLGACGPLDRAEPLRIAFVGDSITHGCRDVRADEPCPGYVELLDDALPSQVEVVNAGVGGATTWAWTEPDLFHRYGIGYDAWLAPHLPVDRVFILLGANDVRVHLPHVVAGPIEPEEFEVRLRMLVARIAADGVVRITLLAPIAQPRASPHTRERLAAYRAIVAEVCAAGPPLECGLRLDDMPEDLFFGLHPSAAGHAWIAKRLLPAIVVR